MPTPFSPDRSQWRYRRRHPFTRMAVALLSSAMNCLQHFLHGTVLISLHHNATELASPASARLNAFSRALFIEFRLPSTLTGNASAPPHRSGTSAVAAGRAAIGYSSLTRLVTSTPSPPRYQGCLERTPREICFPENSIKGRRPSDGCDGTSSYKLASLPGGPIRWLIWACLLLIFKRSVGATLIGRQFRERAAAQQASENWKYRDVGVPPFRPAARGLRGRPEGTYTFSGRARSPPQRITSVSDVETRKFT